MEISKICIFAGTSEGRRLAEFLSDKKQIVKVDVCVATEYGEVLINDEKCDNINVITGRLDCDGMKRLFTDGRYDIVIDATHPYAVIVTDNIKAASESVGLEYIRLSRAESDIIYGRYFDNIGQVTAYLANTDGNILLTTGSKELAEFRSIENYQERIYLRVLPLESSLEICKANGYKSSRIIAMQGPFTTECNTALINMYDIKYLVTKESGTAGGFAEKVNAAQNAGIECVIIGRPPQAEGYSFDEVIAMLNLTVNKKITIIGAGVGSARLLTAEARECLRNCDVVIGAERVAESCNIYHKPCYNAFLSDEIITYINGDKEYTNYAVVMSGDIGFYSGAKKLIDNLECDVELICGISSPIYMCSKLGIAWENVKLLSLHARDCNFIHCVKTNYRTFALTGKIPYILEQLIEFNLNVKVYIGERLSYDNEKITVGSPAELTEYEFDSLASVIIENAEFNREFTIGIDDEEFIRAESVPMTKSEIRALVIAKLRLSADSVIYDVGAGTGSVSVEAALLSYDGIVYAVERKHEAVETIKANITKFRTANIVAIEGTAPEALEELPPPTHVFIGGTAGSMKGIIEAVTAKNPQVRIVITAITLETVADSLQCIKEFGLTAEITQINAAKSKKLGGYNMMMGQNPVYIISCEVNK